MIIDTPGMRELGSIGATDGIQESFSDIEELSSRCQFGDCSHTNEKGCAVLEAIATGLLDEDRFQSYLKLMNESRFHQMSFLEKKKKDKDFGRMVKAVKKHGRMKNKK
jgi:ribosome biogenesis GTPase